MIFEEKNKDVEVAVNDGGLVAVFGRASPPIVWRFDLHRNHSFAVRLKPEVDGWDIGVDSPDAEFLPIAHFAQETDAQKAFIAIQKILTRRKGSAFWTTLKYGAALIAVAALLAFAYSAVGALINHFSSAVPRGVPMAADMAIEAPESAPVVLAPVPRPSAPQPGVPQSADDVLQAPQ